MRAWSQELFTQSFRLIPTTNSLPGAPNCGQLLRRWPSSVVPYELRRTCRFRNSFRIRLTGNGLGGSDDRDSGPLVVRQDVSQLRLAERGSFEQGEHGVFACEVLAKATAYPQSNSLACFPPYPTRDIRRFFCSATAVQEDKNATWMSETTNSQTRP